MPTHTHAIRRGSPARSQLALSTLTLLAFTVVGCGGGGGRFDTNNCRDFDSVNCVEIEGGDSAALQAAVNSLEDDTTLILGPGVFVLDNQVTIRNADGVSLVGQGIEETTLSFSTAAAQINGVDVVGDDFLVQDLTVLDAPKDGIRVENSDGVTFRRIRATWTEEGLSTNGAYGIYPVKSRNVLVEDSFAENASDAGLYVGQCINVVVRRNTVRGNVAGLEIENTEYADVYENHAEDNTGGIVVFDLPGNPIVGRDVRLHDNTIIRNNRRNFAPGGTVAQIPAGTGTFVMASRRVEVVDNEYTDNKAFDIAIVSGLIIADDPAVWELETASLVGDWDDLGLLAGATQGTITNFRSENIVISGNSHSQSMPTTNYGLSPDFAALFTFLYGNMHSDNIIYDGIGESMFDAVVAANNSNDNHICAGGNTDGTFANINALSQLSAPPTAPILQIADAPFAPYDCTAVTGGALVLPEL
ncbi:MAG: right-handed parallel beta-helix repeat-containing protein [Myxococcales bacterium]|nr:right-handed parallel beta-helix repeat-containing protein [Myxococcales bacterium]MCB9628229.1 right-handed parallel beta-helix repeat-containing protein [Sandaracinaceae bacterium]